MKATRSRRKVMARTNMQGYHGMRGSFSAGRFNPGVVAFILDFLCLLDVEGDPYAIYHITDYIRRRGYRFHFGDEAWERIDNETS